MRPSSRSLGLEERRRIRPEPYCESSCEWRASVSSFGGRYTEVALPLVTLTSRYCRELQGQSARRNQIDLNGVSVEASDRSTTGVKSLYHSSIEKCRSGCSRLMDPRKVSELTRVSANSMFKSPPSPWIVLVGSPHAYGLQVGKREESRRQLVSQNSIRLQKMMVVIHARSMSFVILSVGFRVV